MRLLQGGLFFAAIACSAAAEATFFSYYDGKSYQFKISEAEQRRRPQWNPEKDAHPPYAAAQALTQAKKFIAGVSTSSETFWRFEDLALVEVSGGWAWRARYILTLRGPSTGVWPTMDCWILMDGTVVKPIIAEDRTRSTLPIQRPNKAPEPTRQP